jgi:Dyp-type peroxidase family
MIDWSDVQGNILGGFNKDYQTLLGLEFGSNLVATKAFIAWLTDRVTDLEAVLTYKAARSRRMLIEGAEPSDMPATWTCVSFSFAGLSFLTAEANDFTDPRFRNGLYDSSSSLGDPQDPASPGNIANWKLGGSAETTPSMFVIVGADLLEDLRQAVNAIQAEATAAGCSQIYLETGRDLSSYSTATQTFPSGHEQFGFKDGISQPGIRGMLPTDEPLTPRSLKSDPVGTGIEYAAIGKPLICLGQFLLGYAQQVDVAPRQPGPPIVLGSKPYALTPDASAPWWAFNGSFLVFRRLRQDVSAFRSFAAKAASAIGSNNIDAARMAALCVGRWPTGASVMRTPMHDDAKQARPDIINAFAYGDQNAALELPVDNAGTVCPVSAHLRKVNPRDVDTDRGAASATLLRRLLRRGIPYGPPFDLGGAADADRGLLFLSFQSSIANQFEFLCSRWMNQAVLPDNPSGHAEGLGNDMLVGQGFGDRVRFAYIRIATPNSGPPDDYKIGNTQMDVKDWVVPTGGGYFFTPSLSAMRDVLCI